MADPSLSPHAYVLAVHDLPKSVAYFVDVLGFEKDWNDGDNWQAVVRDGVRVMLGRCPGAMAVSQIGDHSYFAFISTNRVDDLHREFEKRGATILFVRSIAFGAGVKWRSQPLKVTE